jgi:hypothetical protein
MNLMIALDARGFMAAIGDNSSTKLKMAKQSIQLIFQQLHPSDRFGIIIIIITYTESSKISIPFSLRSDITEEQVKIIVLPIIFMINLKVYNDD